MKALIFLTAMVGLIACQKDPYGGKTPTDGAPEKPIQKPEPLPGANGLQIQSTMNFLEGQKGEFIVKGLVKTGSPVVVFTNLPAGAAYDKNAEKLIWTPDYAAANDPRDPAILMQIYTVKAALFSSDDMSTELLTADVDLIVKDSPKPASLKSPLEMTGTEGSMLTHKIDFEDQEYPQGPFEIALSGLPAEAQLIWPDRKVPSFTLQWTPSYTKVLNSTSANFTADITLYNPRGKRLQFSIRWTIDDNHLAPVTAGPNSVAQPGDMDFIVMAEDPNGEMAPDWQPKLKPPYGFFTVTTQAINGPGLPKSTGIVSWKGVPKDKLGTPQNAELNACVNGFVCTTHKVTLLPMVSPPSKPTHGAGK